MDHVVEWKTSEDPASLLEAIRACKQGLTNACFSKSGAARISSFDVLASKKICDFLMLSDHGPPVPEDDVPWMKCVGTYPEFRLYRFKHVDDETIRVLITFDVGENIPRAWYGNVVVS